MRINIILLLGLLLLPVASALTVQQYAALSNTQLQNSLTTSYRFERFEETDDRYIWHYSHNTAVPEYTNGTLSAINIVRINNYAFYDKEIGDYCLTTRTVTDCVTGKTPVTYEGKTYDTPVVQRDKYASNTYKHLLYMRYLANKALGIRTGGAQYRTGTMTNTVTLL